MADDHGYWVWRDALLLHPDGRAIGGEPCAGCGNPVPANAHWKHRDRHVCGPRCNSNLGRRLNRQIAKGSEMPLLRPEPLADPRATVGPRAFRTVAANASELPFEFEGFGPRAGDTIERFGVTIQYRWRRVEHLAEMLPDAPHGVLVVSHESGHSFLLIADGTGGWGDGLLGDIAPDGTLRRMFEPFEFNGARLLWHVEHIRALTAAGDEYTWKAVVCLPVEQVPEGPLWSASYRARSEQRERISSSAARHERRVRAAGAIVERFDPLEVFERDGWICQLCSETVDRELSHPDPMGPSLDHRIPLVAGGEHSRTNTQLAHWICNVRKGASMPS